MACLASSAARPNAGWDMCKENGMTMGYGAFLIFGRHIGVRRIIQVSFLGESTTTGLMLGTWGCLAPGLHWWSEYPQVRVDFSERPQINMEVKVCHQKLSSRP
jgi:hypothetical protein